VTLPAEGTVSFRLRVPEGYWRSRGESCRFPPIVAEGLFVEVAITAEHAVEVFADGPGGRAWTLTSPPLRHAPAALALALAWDAAGVVLYLDGERVAGAV
jgi:hypothetical protein